MLPCIIRDYAVDFAYVSVYSRASSNPCILLHCAIQCFLACKNKICDPYVLAHISYTNVILHCLMSIWLAISTADWRQRRIDLNRGLFHFETISYCLSRLSFLLNVPCNQSCTSIRSISSQWKLSTQKIWTRKRNSGPWHGESRSATARNIRYLAVIHVTKGINQSLFGRSRNQCRGYTIKQ